MIKVKTLKPISDGNGKRGGTFIQAGLEIDLEKDVANWRDKDIHAAAEEMERLGYIKILKPKKVEEAPEPKEVKPKSAPKKATKISKQIDKVKK